MFGQPAFCLWKHSTHSVGSSTSSRLRRTGGCDADDDEEEDDDDDEDDDDAPTIFAAAFLDDMARIDGFVQMRLDGLQCEGEKQIEGWRIQKP